jgi:hypothetical protein
VVDTTQLSVSAKLDMLIACAMRPNQPSPTLLPFVLEGFSWPGNPRVLSRISDASLRVHRQGAEEFLELLRQHPGAYVSCQDHNVLELNPAYSNMVTPQGIYAFPRDFIAHMAWWLTMPRDNYPTSGVGFLHRPTLFVFDLDGPIADSDTYTHAALVHDLETLARQWQTGSPAVQNLPFEVDPGHAGHIARRWLRDVVRHSTDSADQQLKHLIWSSEKMVDSMLPTRDSDGDGYQEHEDKPALWRHLLAGLGYSGVADHHALLTGDIEQQLAVLQPTAIRNLVRLPNPLNREIALGSEQQVPAGMTL